jgi:sugar O-acyltransferase (sialic acid O-acetyltransferase NeuD family)
MNKIVIFGAGPLAHLAYIHFSNAGQYEVVAFTVNEEYLKEDKFFGLNLVAFEQIEKIYPPDKFSMFVALGYTRVNKARAQIYNSSKAKGYHMVSCIEANVIDSINYKVGENSLIMPNTVIQPFAEVGNDVIIWNNSYIGYKSYVRDHTYIGPDAVIAGNVEIGQYCFIGANATIRDRVIVAPECVIGAGAIILKNTEAGKVYRGQRAEVLPYLSSELRSI